MAEYIDKNKLIRDLIDNRSFYPAIVKNAIENAPTADVVPRSEVEKAVQEVVSNIVFDVDNMLFKFFQDNYYHYQLDEVWTNIRKKYIGE